MTNTATKAKGMTLSSTKPTFKRHFSGLRRFGILIVTGGLFIALAIISPVFLTFNNLVNVLDRAAPTGIIECALTVVVISGRIDFSVGSMYGFAGVVAVLSLPLFGIAGAMLAGLAACAILELINGLLVAYGGIDSFITTLVMSIVIAGLGLVVTGGSLVSALTPGFEILGNGRIAGVNLSIWIFAVIAIILAILLTKTVFGRHIFGIGDSLKAARLSGVRVHAVVISSFVVSGLAAGIAGLIITSRTSQAQPQDGITITIAAIAAVVIGGTSISGGRGSIWRTVVGVILLSLIGNGTNLLRIDPVFQQIIQGLIILVAIVAERITQRGGDKTSLPVSH